MSLQFRERFTQDFDRINDHLNQSSSRKKRTTKIQKKTLDWLIDNFDFNRSHLVTLHLNDKLSYKKEIKDLVFHDISKIVTRFRRKLENRVFSKRSNKRLEIFTVIEGLKWKTERNHIHMIISTEQHISKEMMIVEMVNSFHRTKCLVDIHVVKIGQDKTNLVDYLTKELKQREITLDDETIDWKNSRLTKDHYLQVNH